VILQRDQRLRPNIKRWGCYYMSILFLANKYKNTPFSVTTINNNFYLGNVQRGAMDKQCFIKDPDAVFASAGLKVQYTGKHEDKTRACKRGEIEILYYEHPDLGGHFVAGDGRGNVAYDPWGVSMAVEEGELVSKRIFKLLE